MNKKIIKATIIFFIVHMFLGCSSSVKANATTIQTHPTNLVPVVIKKHIDRHSIEFATKEEIFIFDNLREFDGADEIAIFLGNGNDEDAFNRIGFFSDSRVFYVHSGTSQRGLGNFLKEKVNETDEISLDVDVRLDNTLIGNELMFINKITKDKIFQGKKGGLYIITCLGHEYRIIFEIK